MTRHPLNPAWPLELLSTFTFEDLGKAKTRFSLRWSPHRPTDAKQKTFDEGHGSMTQGWSDMLEAYLAKTAGAG